jgi:hypothetical protein
MKLLVRMLGLTAFCLAVVSVGASFLTSQPSANNQIALTGIISDSMCGAKHMMSGDDAKCTHTCVKNGSQYALVSDDKVYALAGQNEELDKLAGRKVVVTGSMADSIFQIVTIKPAQPDLSAKTKSSADTDTPPATTIEGLVRDIACPIQNKEATATKFNLKCAQDCARLGSPLIVLTEDGTLYTPISESMPDQDQRQRLMPFLGKYVRVTGPVYERNGTRAIAIKTIEEMKDVHLTTNAE